MGRFLAPTGGGPRPRRTPDLRHIVRVPIEADDGTWDEFIDGPPHRCPRSTTEPRPLR